MRQQELAMDVPLARDTDPRTSQEAAAEVEVSESRHQWMQRIERAIERYPGCTRNELCERTGITVDTVGKRLSDLDHAGRVCRGTPRRCSVSGRKAATWHPVGIKQAATEAT